MCLNAWKILFCKRSRTKFAGEYKQITKELSLSLDLNSFMWIKQK